MQGLTLVTSVLARRGRVCICWGNKKFHSASPAGHSSILGRGHLHELQKFRGSWGNNIPWDFYEDASIPRFKDSSFLSQCSDFTIVDLFSWAFNISGDLKFFFFQGWRVVAPVACGSSQARVWTYATAVIQASSVTTGYLTHWASWKLWALKFLDLCFAVSCSTGPLF